MRSRCQHRILALDGGGIRGTISVEVLAHLETMLRKQTGDPDLRLCDWFDLIAGTSTGAISAALLATGHTVDDLRTFYDREARALFQPARLSDRIRHRYSEAQFVRRLKDVFGTMTLGSEKIRTLLLLVLHNISTDSPWFITNIPEAKFNDPSLPDCNLHLPLWQVIRGSAAAPTWFRPQTIHLRDQTFVFGDGFLTGYDNPAFKAFLLATVAPYGLSWPVGPDKLLVVSVGTGADDYSDREIRPSKMYLWYQALSVPNALRSSNQQQSDLLCRVFGNCLVGDAIDLEVGDLIGVAGPVEPKLFTYLRYNVVLNEVGMASIGCGHIDATKLGADALDRMEEMREVGASLARTRLRRQHIEDFISPVSE